MYGNSYFNQPHRFQSMDNFNQQFNTQQYMTPIQQPSTQLGLLGKSVDSIEVVKAMDIPLDGSISYFPLTDGSAIVTKKLQNDGTSKTVIYKPAEENNDKGSKFVTFEEMQRELENIDFGDLEDLKDEIRDLKKELKELKNKKNKEN